jgi:hypothetical protein
MLNSEVTQPDNGFRADSCFYHQPTEWKDELQTKAKLAKLKYTGQHRTAQNSKQLLDPLPFVTNTQELRQ